MQRWRLTSRDQNGASVARGCGRDSDEHPVFLFRRATERAKGKGAEDETVVSLEDLTLL